MMWESFWVPVILKATLADALTSSSDTYVCKEAEKKGLVHWVCSEAPGQNTHLYSYSCPELEKELDPEC